MSTLSRESKLMHTIVHSNPVLSRLSKITERTQTNAATYTGITRNTTCFLLIQFAGNGSKK